MKYHDLWNKSCIVVFVNKQLPKDYDNITSFVLVNNFKVFNFLYILY